MKHEEDWKTEKISEAFVVRPPKKEAREKLKGDDLVSFLPMEDLQVMAKEIIAKKEKRLNDVSGTYTYFAENDVLLAKITPCFENGKLGIARNLRNGIGFGSSEYIVLRSKGEIIPEYLFYFLARDEFRRGGERAMTGAAGQKRVPPGFVESQEIAYPPIPEQQRIVAMLDEAFAALTKVHANAERNRINVREIFKSAQTKIFENNGNKKTAIMKLGDMADFRNGINFTKNSRGETVKIIGVKDFQSRFWVPIENLDSIKIDGKLSETDYLRKGDILAVRSNGNQQLIGRCLLAGEVPQKTTHSGFTIRIRFESHDIFPEYLCHYLKSDKARKQLISSGTGISIKSLNQKTLYALPIPLPPLADQHAVVSKLDSLAEETKRLEEVYQSKLDAVDELKKSIMQRAFQGGL